MTYLLRVLALLTVAPVIAHAQLAHTRQGFGMSVGGHRVTDFGLSGQVCDLSAGTRGGGAYLRMGGYTRPSLFAGAELNATVQTYDCHEIVLLSASFVVQWYPRVATGFYLKGGAGLAAGSNLESYGTGGIALNLGLGYDVRLARNFSLSPQVNYLRIVNTSARGRDAIQLGLGFTWH